MRKFIERWRNKRGAVDSLPSPKASDSTEPAILAGCKLKVYVARKNEPVENAREETDIEMVRSYINVYGQPVIELFHKGNRASAYNAKLYNFWIVPIEATAEAQ